MSFDTTMVGLPCLDAEPFLLRPRMVPLPMAEYERPDQRGLSGSQPVELPKPRVRSQVRRRTPPPPPKFSWKEVAVAFAITFLIGCVALGVWL